MHWRRALPLALLVVGAAVAGAQEPPPRRPRLDASADTNDTYAYYAFGLKRLATRPDEAAAAFWWSARLDPTWADPVYAHYVARLLSRSDLLAGLMEGRARGRRSVELQRLDSLQLRAVALNPLVHRRLDAELIRGYLRQAARRGGPIDPTETDHLIRTYLRDAGDEFRAWLHASDGQFKDAARIYERLVKRPGDEQAELRAALGRVYFQMGDRPRALEQLTLAVRDMRAQDTLRMRPAYESKAIYEHSVALIHQSVDATDSAKAAYARALQEDLSYWPGHRWLGKLLLATGDTAGAIAELGQAVELNGEDAGLRYDYGIALTVANRVDDAVVQFRRATELVPEYAAPYDVLARIHDAAGMADEARGFYSSFVARAAGGDPQLANARQRLAALGPAPASP